jgi:hypothetical protein
MASHKLHDITGMVLWASSCRAVDKNVEAHGTASRLLFLGADTQTFTTLDSLPTPTSACTGDPAQSVLCRSPHPHTLQQFVNPGVGCQTARMQQWHAMSWRWADHTASQVTEHCHNACSALPVVLRHQPTTLQTLPSRSLQAASFDNVSWGFDAATRAILWCHTTARVQSSK